MHQLIETRRLSDNRKIYRCKTCQQEWTRYPHVYCPGVPVVPWNSGDHGALRTRTQAKKEYYLVPRDAKPVAALRLEADPWYIFLYDISECEQRLPTEQQRRSTERREQTIREKYGCRLCSKRYLKQDAQYHINGVCSRCRQRVEEWNALVRWAQDLFTDSPQILTLLTEPGPRSVTGTWGNARSYRLTGYQTSDLATGELIASVQLCHPEDYAVLYSLLNLSWLAGIRKPLFLLVGHGDYLLFWEHLMHIFGKKEIGAWQWEALTTHLPQHPPVPRPEGRDWIRFPDETLAQPLYYAALCKIFGLEVEADASVATMLGQVVHHLATQPEIDLLS